MAAKGSEASLRSAEEASTDIAPSPASNSARPTWRRKAHRSLWTNVDAKESHIPLLLYCAATGYIDAITFTAVQVWAAFMTGNTIQLAIAVARTFSGRYASTTTGFQVYDHFALTSLICFCLGAGLQQLGVRWRIADTRFWHVAASLACAVLTLAGALCLVNGSRYGLGTDAESRTQLAWHGARGLAAMGFLSASLGLQGAIAKRMNSSFATTVVLTSVLIDIAANPNIFSLKRVRSRDQRIYAVGFLFLGGFAGRAIVGAIGACPTLGIGAALRVLIALSWFAVPDQPAQKQVAV